MATPFDWMNVCTHAAEAWWTRESGAAAVAAAAERRTRALIEHAGTHSPFYRERWRGAALDRVRLQDLPVVTKPELMARFDDWLTDRDVDLAAVTRFLADRSRIGALLDGKYTVWKSSGSTGEPGIYLQDREALAVYDALLAVELQAVDVAGHFAWGVLAQGGRAALVAATGDHFASIASWERVSRASPWRDARAFAVTDPLPSLVDGLNAFQPAFLAGYPTTLALLADEQRAGRLAITPACVWAGGEHLSTAQRAAIERAFSTVVANEYGASECLSIAHSCVHGALHLNADWVVLEPVDRDYRPTPPGERSRTVLLTNLANRIQPVVRYDLGDSVSMATSACACGSPLPTIVVGGRRDDVLCLRASDGSIVRLAPMAVSTVVEEAVGSGRFQVVQTAADEIELRLAVRGAQPRSDEWHAAQAALSAYLSRHALANVRLRLGERAPQADPRSGKTHEVVAAAGVRSRTRGPAARRRPAARR
jgi:phenylacetate-coenzyme A ligase PaaK-like adenylate-forming protein